MRMCMYQYFFSSFCIRFAKSFALAGLRAKNIVTCDALWGQPQLKLHGASTKIGHILCVIYRFRQA